MCNLIMPFHRLLQFKFVFVCRTISNLHRSTANLTEFDRQRHLTFRIAKLKWLSFWENYRIAKIKCSAKYRHLAKNREILVSRKLSVIRYIKTWEFLIASKKHHQQKLHNNNKKKCCKIALMIHIKQNVCSSFFLCVICKTYFRWYYMIFISCYS